MKEVIVSNWNALMDNEHNPLRHLDLASQHYVMQVLGWMWSMVFSLMFLSIVQFGVTWALHVIAIAGITMTISIFKQAEKVAEEDEAVPELSKSSACVWKLDNEA